LLCWTPEKKKTITKKRSFVAKTKIEER